MTIIRQILFNLCFYGFTFLFCLLTLPCLLLPRPIYFQILLWYFRTVYQIEKYVLGLDYEVRGIENLPSHGPYIIAAKHFSAYETMKLHILFPDPAIIMKAELKSIPLWGWHAAKSDMIFIDRGSRDVALKSIINGGKRMKDLGRPIIIFPQGTRVNIHDPVEKRPYKHGIIRMYDALDLPIIPMAIDSGVYWGKDAFLKTPGKAVFEFLPPIPVGTDSDVAFRTMVDSIESASQKLVSEALVKTAVK